MRGFAALVILLMLAVLVSGCTQIKDCASDRECFLAAAETCTPAKLTTSLESGEGEFKTSITIESQISSKEGNDCIFFMRIKELTVPQNVPSDLAQDFNNLKGSSMICRVPTDAEINTFEELQTKLMDVYSNECSGTYKTLSEQLYKKLLDAGGKTTYGIQLVSADCTDGEASFIIRNVGTVPLESNDIRITRTEPRGRGNIQKPTTIVSGATGEIKDPDCGHGDICIYRVSVSGQTEEVYVQC